MIQSWLHVERREPHVEQEKGHVCVCLCVCVCTCEELQGRKNVIHPGEMQIILYRLMEPKRCRAGEVSCGQNTKIFELPSKEMASVLAHDRPSVNDNDGY